MVKRLLLLGLVAFALSAQAQYQLQNSGFEDWETVTGNGNTGEEPVNWNSFLTANIKVPPYCKNQPSPES